MLTIDAQVHPYERNHAGRPWQGHLHGPDQVTGEDMVAAMDAVGVDGAILIPPFSIYRFDSSYAEGVHAAHPDRFRMVKPVDFDDPAVGETIADWAKTPGAVGVRIVLLGDMSRDPAHPGMSRVIQEAGRHGLPVNMLVWGRLDQFAGLARAHPDTQMLVDHVGMTQHFAPPKPEAPFAELPKLLALAALDNVAVKISGAGTLSHEPYPYPDLWEPLGRVFDAFGFDRCLWGSDWTRATAFLTYPQAVEPYRLTDRLSDGDRAKLMGGTLSRIYGWAPEGRAPRS